MTTNLILIVLLVAMLFYIAMARRIMRDFNQRIATLEGNAKMVCAAIDRLERARVTEARERLKPYTP